MNGQCWKLQPGIISGFETVCAGFIRRGAEELEKLVKLMHEAETKQQKAHLQEMKDSHYSKAFLEANSQELSSFEHKFYVCSFNHAILSFFFHPPWSYGTKTL